MWLIDSVRENYEVPVALILGVLFILLYKRLLKGPEDGESSGKSDREKEKRHSKGEKNGQPVKKEVKFNIDKPQSPEKEQKLEDLPVSPKKPADPASLRSAVKMGDVETVGSLLEQGADPSILDRDSNTYLHIMFKDISTMPLIDANEIFVLLLSNIPKESQSVVNTINRDGKTPLHLAVSNTTPSLVRLLLDKGADRSIPDKDGNTPLHIIVEYMQFSQVPAEKEILDLLVKHYPREGLESDATGPKPGINAVNDEQLTPLHIAVMHEETDNVRVLLEGGADPNIPDVDGNTPLHTMMMNLDQKQDLSSRDRELLMMLLNAKADVVRKNNKDQSVLCLVTNPEIEEEILNT